jgi:hypothetical protein
VSCSAATPKPETVPPQARLPQTALVPPPAHVRIEREVYAGKLLFLMRHGWRTPTELQADPMSLRTLAHVEINHKGMFVDYRVSRSSGNPLFDQSVADQLQGLIDRGARAESGPPYVVDQIFGEVLTVLFTGPPPPGTPPY